MKGPSHRGLFSYTMRVMKKLIIAIAVVAAFGVADASFLSYYSLAELPIPCSYFEGCNEVAQSPYAKVFGIPLALFGVAFYAFVLALALLILRRPNRLAVRALQAFGFLAFVLSGYFMYLQAFVIGAFCIYCIMSAIFSTAIFILSLFLRPETEPAPLS